MQSSAYLKESPGVQCRMRTGGSGVCPASPWLPHSDPASAVPGSSTWSRTEDLSCPSLRWGCRMLVDHSVSSTWRWTSAQPWYPQSAEPCRARGRTLMLRIWEGSRELFYQRFCTVYWCPEIFIQDSWKKPNPVARWYQLSVWLQLWLFYVW